MLNGHGDDIYDKSCQIKANFSSNVPKNGNIDKLQAFWADNLNVFVSYPEANAESFVDVLAEKYNLRTSQIVATHGATEAIYLTAQIFAHKSSAIFQPAFAEYEDACKIYRHKLLHIYAEEKLQYVNADVVWLCNPNNPTGKALEYDKLLQIIDANTNKIFVVDQTYRYFTVKKTLSYQDAVVRPNLILIDSFTKRYSVPGLRLGYMIANENIIKKIIAIKPPWSVNQLAIETGKYLLNDANVLPLDLRQILDNANFLQSALSKIPNIEVYPTDTHFFLCKLQNITALNLKNILINDYGVLIRNADNFNGLDEYFIRIASQSESDNLLLTNALEKVLIN